MGVATAIIPKKLDIKSKQDQSYKKRLTLHRMTDLHQQIADLEAEIDALSDAAEQCRKSMIVAKVAIGGGILCSWCLSWA